MNTNISEVGSFLQGWRMIRPLDVALVLGLAAWMVFTRRPARRKWICRALNLGLIFLLVVPIIFCAAYCFGATG